jgi:hypothetical protein
MKIVERSLSEEQFKNNDYREEYEIIVDGKSRISANDYGEPEDNTLGRDLGFIYSIVGLMKEAYEAGKRGEELVIEQIEGERE